MGRQLLTFLVLALLTFGVYSNHFENAFHFDDFHTIVDNARIHSLADPLKFFRDPAAFSVLTTHQVFRPVVSLSLALDWHLSGGAKPLWFHISTFFWFLVLLAVLRALFGRLLESSGWAWFATAIFAFHPVSAETVNYVILSAARATPSRPGPRRAVVRPDGKGPAEAGPVRLDARISG